MTGPLHELAIGCVFRDEAPYLREWIEFHRMLGVQHFYLVNDRSLDDYGAVLAPYQAADLVTLIERPCPERLADRGWIEYQRGIYQALCGELAGRVSWLALIDVDEFLVPESEEESVPDVLARHAGCAAVHVRWEPFGTSHLASLDPALPMLAQLRLKWRFRAGHEMLGKSIVRPERVTKANIHHCELAQGEVEHDCNPQMARATAELKLYHYWSRDERFLWEVKLPRTAAIKDWDLERIGKQYFHDLFNEEHDTVMPRYLDRLVGRLQAEP